MAGASRPRTPAEYFTQEEVGVSLPSCVSVGTAVQAGEPMTAQGEAPPFVAGWIIRFFLAQILTSLTLQPFFSMRLREISSFMISFVPP